MIVLGVDPGYERSAAVLFDGGRVIEHCVLQNGSFLCRILDKHWRADMMVIEKIESMGMAVGKETFETVFWSGRFAEAWDPQHWTRITRREVKLTFCGSSRAKDANIRQALIDLFGPSKEKAIGRKASPGPLFGIAGDEWSALAVAVTWWKTNISKGQ